jgi:Zn-finger nucleic acid-binding protein
MTAAAPSCPRCALALAEISLEGARVKACAKCHGTLLDPPQLGRVLGALSEKVLASFDPDATLDPVNDASGRLPCPSCARPMDSVDYCGARTVHFDRCDRCALSWINADELGTMTLMWARMELRHRRTHAQTEQLLEGMSGLTRRQRIARVVSNVIFRALG